MPSSWGRPLLAVAAILFAACASSSSVGRAPILPQSGGATSAAGVCTFPTDCRFPTPPPYNPTSVQREVDDIYTLLAYSIVFKGWQTTTDQSTSRGYNIGSVLVDPGNNLVCWAVNSVNISGNSTNHGEVRLMSNYLGNTKRFSLPTYSVYTTLEPCAMCAGMMTLQSVGKTIYGQRDPDYGAAIGRLILNSKAMGGYCPYPRGVISAEAGEIHAQALDNAYCLYYTSQQSPSITKWLTTPEAKAIYADASLSFLNYKVKYPENQTIYNAARKFFASVPSDYQPIPYTVNCPPPGIPMSQVPDVAGVH